MKKNEKYNPERRLFFQKAGEASLKVATFTTATTGALIGMNPIIPMAIGELAYTSVTEGYMEKGLSKRDEEVDIVHKNLNYQNVGVTHTTEALTQDREFLEDCIKRTDIVLLEEGDIYFGVLESIAKKHNKRVIYIDNQSFLNAQIVGISSVLPILIAGKNIVHHKELRTVGGMIKQTRRNVLAGIVGLNGFIATYPIIYGQIRGKRYPSDDISYMVDGRTVFMLQNIEDVKNKNPGKRLLSITGDVHARGIEYYLENREAFESRKAWYNKTYGLFEGSWYEK